MVWFRIIPSVTTTVLSLGTLWFFTELVLRQAHAMGTLFLSLVSEGITGRLSCLLRGFQVWLWASLFSGHMGKRFLRKEPSS